MNDCSIRQACNVELAGLAVTFFDEGCLVLDIDDDIFPTFLYLGDLAFKSGWKLRLFEFQLGIGFVRIFAKQVVIFGKGVQLHSCSMSLELGLTSHVEEYFLLGLWPL